jgi:hypothetical protein
MAVGRHDEDAERLLRQVDIVHITAVAGDEALILDPAYRLSDTKFVNDCVHGVPLVWLEMMASPRAGPDGSALFEPQSPPKRKLVGITIRC